MRTLWETLSAPWRACIEEAWAASCAGSIPHGAAVVGPDVAVLARGRNRVNEAAGTANVFFGTKLAHAEMNALLGFDPAAAAVPATACALYATTEPCDHCAGAALVSRVGEVRYASRDPRGGRADLLLTHAALRPEPLRVVGPERPDLEAALMALRAEYWLRSGVPDAPAILASWEQVLPLAVRVGQRLRESPTFTQQREHAAPAAKALHTIASFIR